MSTPTPQNALCGLCGTNQQDLKLHFMDTHYPAIQQAAVEAEEERVAKENADSVTPTKVQQPANHPDTTPLKTEENITPYCSWCGDQCSRWSSIKRHAKTCVGNPHDGSSNIPAKQIGEVTPTTVDSNTTAPLSTPLSHSITPLVTPNQSPTSSKNSGPKGGPYKQASTPKTTTKADNTVKPRSRGRPTNSERLLLSVSTLPGIQLQKQRVRQCTRTTTYQ